MIHPCGTPLGNVESPAFFSHCAIILARLLRGCFGGGLEAPQQRECDGPRNPHCPAGGGPSEGPSIITASGGRGSATLCLCLPVMKMLAVMTTVKAFMWMLRDTKNDIHNIISYPDVHFTLNITPSVTKQISPKLLYFFFLRKRS